MKNKPGADVVLSAATFNAIVNFLISSEWRRADPILRLIGKEFQSRQAGNIMSVVARGNGEDKEGEVGPSA